MIINLFGYIISLFIGLLTIRTLRVAKLLTLPLCLPVSLLLGLSISSSLFLISLYLFGQFNQGIVLGTNFFVLFILSLYNVFFKPKQIEPCCLVKDKLKYPLIFYFSSGIFSLFFIIAVSILSQQYPYGGWDAWGLYNMKAKFLLFAENNWKDVATSLHWHTQPSYPLLLPLINSWIFSFLKTNLTRVASLTSIVLCLGTGFLLWAGLFRFLKTKIAFLGFMLLASNLWWIFWATTQYADILFSYFLLANLILLILSLKEKHKNLCLLLGLLLGFMTFAKNEGIACALILIFLYSTYLIFNKETSRKDVIQMILYLCCGLLIGSLCTVLFRLTIAPPTREVQLIPIGQKLPYFNFNGFYLTVRFYIMQFFAREWNFVWIALFLAGILQFPRLINKELKIFSLFFLLYAATLLYIYMSTAHFSLMWRLFNTASRILANLLPSVVFFIFYSIWSKKT